MHKIAIFIAVLLLVFSAAGMMGGLVEAAGEANNGYLHYQEPQPTTVSWAASGAYLISLLFTFAVIIGMAYFATRFLGQKMGGKMGLGNNSILSSIFLGNNRAIYVVEISGHFLIVGVTDHNITLLQEINSPEEIIKLRAQTVNASSGQFDGIFRRHLASLNQMTNKFPSVFGAAGMAEPKKTEQKDTREKR